MKTRVISLTKHFFGLFVALVVWAAFVAPAAAETQYHYQYQPVQWQYQQPVYYQYQYNTQHIQNLQKQLQALLAQLNTLQIRYQTMYGHSYGGYRGDYDLEVDTLYARDVDDEEATLYGEVDLDDAPFANVWFEYGEDSDLDERSDKKRVTDDDRFHIDIDDLDEDERYYFRAIAEAPNGDRAYGQIKSFDADESDDDDDNDHDDDDDHPDIETGDADEITDDSVRLEGEVDMNDFEDGEVFLVYGEDEGDVEDAEDEESYSDIEEDGDDIRKERVSSNVDDNRSFWVEIFGLNDDAEYYYRFCVEYEDEDGDDTLMCGDVESFETDRD